MNRVCLVGRLTKDPACEYVNSSTRSIARTRFTLAVDRRSRDDNNNRTADFISCIAWRNQAENLCKYQKKGSQIGVTGHIQTGSYDAQDGTKRYTTDVIADRVMFLGSKGESSNTNYDVSNDAPVETADLSEDPYANMGEETVLSDEDLPF